MLHLLTAERGGGGGGGDGNSNGSGERGEGGKFVLESRPASRRLETVIAERTRDVNFRVVAAALKLFGGLVEAHPALMAGHTSALLPSVREEFCLDWSHVGSLLLLSFVQSVRDKVEAAAGGNIGRRFLGGVCVWIGRGSCCCCG